MRVVVLLDPSVLLQKKSTEIRSKCLWDKLHNNGEIENRENFSIFSFLAFGFGGQSGRKWDGRRQCKFLYEEEETV